MKTKINKHPNWRTTSSQRLSYYLGRTGLYNLQMLIPTFMNLFLIFNGVDLAVVAAITLIVRIIDSVDDVIFGFIVDKIDIKKNKFLKKIGGDGRYLPWLRCFMYLFPFAILLFFLMPSSLSDGGKLVWFTVTYLLFDLTFTLVDVPTQSSLQTVTDVPEERNTMTTYAYLLVTIITVITIFAQQILISEDVGLSIRTVAIACVVIFSAMLFPMPFKIKETNAELKNTEQPADENYTIKEMFQAVKSNRPFFINLIAEYCPKFLATGAGVTLFVSFYLYGSSTAMTIPGIIGSVLMIVVQVFAPKISEKFGNRKALIASFTVTAICSLTIYIAGPSRFGVIVAMTILSSAVSGVTTMLSAYIRMQTIEYSKYKTGRDTTGIYNAINTLFAKISESVGMSLGMFLLSIFGWVTVNAESFADLAEQGIEQSATALSGLWMINALIPAIGVILSVITLLFYNLTDEDARLMSQCNVGEITREECEARLSRKY